MLQELERFKAITAGHDPWATIDDLVATCDAQGFWEQEWLDTTTDVAKKTKVRRLIRQVKDADQWPAWSSIVIADTDGVRKRLYKQEVLFNVEDYRQVVTYWVGSTQYGMKMAQGYRDHAVKRYAVQLSLPWE